MQESVGREKYNASHGRRSAGDQVRLWSVTGEVGDAFLPANEREVVK